MKPANTKRLIQAFAATVLCVGLALASLSLWVGAALSFTLLSGLAESPAVLSGLPLAIFALTLLLLLRRVQASVVTSVCCAAVGLLALYWLGGFVLMQTACGFHSGGC